MKYTLALLALLLVATLGCDLGDPNAVYRDTDASSFQVGQVWKYQTRPQEADSTLVVDKVETDPEGKTVVHVGVVGVQFKTPAGIQTTIPHMPFEESALQASVTTKVRDDGALTDFKPGYNIWRDAVQDKKGGVFAISVAEAITSIEENIAQGP